MHVNVHVYICVYVQVSVKVCTYIWRQKSMLDVFVCHSLPLPFWDGVSHWICFGKPNSMDLQRDTVSRWQAHTTSHDSGRYWVLIQQVLYCLSCVQVPVGNGFLKYYIFIYLFCVCICMYVEVLCRSRRVEEREQLAGVGSLLLQCGFWGSNSLPGMVASAFPCWAIFAGPGGDLMLWFFESDWTWDFMHAK